MAGTVKHPGSAEESRASPTVGMDGTHTTQRPSRSSSRDSEMSSSALSAGARTLPSSGLMLSCSQVLLNQHVCRFSLNASTFYLCLLRYHLQCLELSDHLLQSRLPIPRPRFYKSMIRSNLFPSEGARLSAAEFVECLVRCVPNAIKPQPILLVAPPTLTQSRTCMRIMKPTSSKGLAKPRCERTLQNSDFGTALFPLFPPWKEFAFPTCRTQQLFNAAAYGQSQS